MIRPAPRRAARVARVARARVVAVGFAVLLVLTACTGNTRQAVPGPPEPTGPYSVHPNIVFVLTDDLSDDLVRYMPHVIALEQAGMKFTNFTTTDSLCCPSRASIFSGDFPHNTKVFTNGLPDGGFQLFHERGEEKHTFAVSLHNAGYRTAMMGKYLNQFRVPSRGKQDPADAHYVPPGWSDWAVAGFGYHEYNYDLDINHHLHTYGHKPKDYLTNVISGLGQRFIRSSARQRKPFFLELATFAPHSPAIPAPQDKGSFKLQAPRSSSFDRLPTHAPPWLASLPPLTSAGIQTLDKVFTKRVESVQAVDRMIGDLERTLQKTGQLSNTIFVFNSDNGYHIGQHGLGAGKLTAFDTDVKVPLVLAGPGIAAGSVNHDIVENTDLAPTFDQLAGAKISPTVDGKSFLPLLHGELPPWRTLATVEHHGPVYGPTDPDHQTHLQGNPPSYDAIRAASWTYVRYVTGAIEYYNRRTDPDENHNIAGQLTPRRIAHLNAILDKLTTCRGTAQCWQAAEPTAG